MLQKTEADVAPGVRPRKPARRWLRILLGVVVIGGGAAALVHYQPWKLLHRPATTTAVQRGMMGGPTPVAVATVTTADVPVVLNGLGTVTPLATVTIRSRISGYLTNVAFKEGQAVKKGDLLAEIDCRSYAAVLEQNQGDLAQIQAQLDNARIDLARYQKLRDQDSISKQNVDTQAASVREFEGSAKAAQGRVDAAQVDLGDCRITSPIDGRVGLRQVDAGNYVSAGDSTGIAVVTQVQPISVVFTLPEDKIGDVAAEVRAGQTLKVDAYDRTNSKMVAAGTLMTLDNVIDTATGTVKLRAEFPNTDETLFPNQFVNARLLVKTLHDAMVVPSAAVQIGTPGSFVYLVGADDTVSLRTVETGLTQNGETVITSGLAVGDRVVVDGVDRLRDKARVSVREIDGKPVGREDNQDRPSRQGSPLAENAAGPPA